MNPSAYRRVDLDTWLYIMKKFNDETYSESLLRNLCEQGITIEDLGREAEDFLGIGCRALSAVELFNRSVKDEFACDMLNTWIQYWTEWGYDIVADNMSYVKSCIQSFTGMEL